MIRTRFKLPPEKRSRFDEAGRRVRLLLPCDDESSDAIVTDDLSAALAYGEVGKHVLWVGPFKRDMLQPLDSTCRQAGGRFMPAHSWRFIPAMQTLQQSLANLGEPGLLRIHRWQPGAEKLADIEENILAEIDLLTWVFSDLPNVVCAKGHNVGNGSYAQIHFGFEGNGMALLDYAWGLPGSGAYQSTALLGSKGAAYVDDHRDMHLLFGADMPIAIYADQGSGHLTGLLGEFLNAIQSNRSPSVSLDDTLAALRVTEAVSRSLKTTTVVNLSNH